MNAQLFTSDSVACRSHIPRCWHKSTSGTTRLYPRPVKIPKSIWLSKAQFIGGLEHSYWPGCHWEASAEGWPFSSLIFSSRSILQGCMETKLQISTLQPASPSWAPITPVHENMSQEDTGGLRSVFPSQLCSFFNFIFNDNSSLNLPGSGT